MEPIAAAPPAPSLQQIIEIVGPAILKVCSQDESDEADPDRIWLLRTIHKGSLYLRNLQDQSPALFSQLIGFNGGGDDQDDSTGGSGFSQGYYKSYARKLMGVLGTRMPNVAAVPDNAADEDDIRAAASWSDAAEYIRQTCGLQSMTLQLMMLLFTSGTAFWHAEWAVDGDRYGYKDQPNLSTAPAQLGGSGWDCPACGADVPGDGSNPPPETCPQCGQPMAGAQFRPPTSVPVPAALPPTQVEKGGLEITLHDGSEVAVVLDSDCITPTDGFQNPTPWLRWERERHKADVLHKFGQAARDLMKSGTGTVESTVSGLYGQQIRSAMASPIGLFRPLRDNQWTVTDRWWRPSYYEMIDDPQARQTLQQNFPKGARITTLKGKIVDIKDEKMDAHWVECKPEPSRRIMCEPLGEDWTVVQDIMSSTLELIMQTIERNVEPGFIDSTRIDYDSYQRRRATPGMKFPMVPRAGQALSDAIYTPPALQFSEQIPEVRAAVVDAAENISGLNPSIYGGEQTDPTARQSELKANAAIRQLGTTWMSVGRSLEKLYEKCCRLLAENEDGILAFSKKNQFGENESVAIVVEDMRNGKCHFEAEESVPMTHSAQRDLLMWLITQAPEIMTKFGMDDPMSIPEMKSLMGMPGMRVPNMDARTKGMATIAKLMAAAPIPGAPAPPDPTTGAPGPAGPPQPSIPPDWCDDSKFMSDLAKAWCTVNYQAADANPNGYQNVVLWGTAYETKANAPAAPPPPKTSIAINVKGQDLGDSAVTAALDKSGLLPDGVPAVAVVPPAPAMAPPGGKSAAGPNGAPAMAPPMPKVQ